jgi:hypothetical protein
MDRHHQSLARQRLLRRARALLAPRHDVADESWLSTIERQELAAIHEALDRIDHGGYGWCTRCGHTIDARRLQALPWTALCEPCALAARPRRHPDKPPVVRRQP